MERLPKRVQEALDKLEPRVQKAFLDAVKGVTKAVDIQAVVRALERGDIEAAIRAFRFEVTLFGPVDRALEEAYRAGGIAALATLPLLRDPFDGGRIVLGFNGRNPRAENWAREMSSRLIVGDIVEDQKQAIREALYRGVEAGKNPRQTALDIAGRISPVTGRREGGLIGLSRVQMQWVANARKELESGDYAAFMGRTLRNKTTDRTLVRLSRQGIPLTNAQIERIIQNYNRNLLRYRAQIISRTETLNAYRAGTREGFQQLVDSGGVRNDQIRRIWSATGDLRTRASHWGMNKQELRGLDTPWNVEGSLMLYPGDQSLGALGQHTINCRCWEQIRIDYDPIP